MKPGGFQSEIGRIEDAVQQLDRVWERTQESWRDGNARSVDENFMDPLRQLVAAAIPAIAQLSDVMQSGVRACEDPDDRREIL